MGNYWVNPPNLTSNTYSGLSWVVGEQQNLSWVTTAPSTNVSMQPYTTQEEQWDVFSLMGQGSDNILTDYGRNYFVWTVQAYGSDINSNIFSLVLGGKLMSASFNITDQSGSSSARPTSTATFTSTLGSTKPSASIPAIVTSTLSTVQTATSSPSPSSAPLTGLSRETLGIAIGIGIPGIIAILVTVFILLKQKTLPGENPMQCTSRRVRPCQEVTGDFTYRVELSGDRNSPRSPHFVELPA